MQTSTSFVLSDSLAALLTVLQSLLRMLLVALVVVFVLWSLGALYFDALGARPIIALVFACAILALLVAGKTFWRRTVAVCVACFFVLGWWLTLEPSNTRDWQKDVANTSWASIDGDRVTLHNVRDFSYGSGPDGNVVEHWIARELNLASLTGADIFINFWGSPWMAHPIISFQFADADPIAFSIEIRREIGEDFSMLGGLYRRFELIFVAASERDVIGARTWHREGENVYLYRLALPLDRVRKRFLEYLDSINSLHQSPRWYNAVTSNCTTAIRAQHSRENRTTWDWRILVNGLMDRMLYEKGALVTGSLGFSDLKQQALINEAACSHANSEEFSVLIRKDRVGFPTVR